VTTHERARTFVVLSALALASCTVGPTYHRPAAPMQTAFKEPPPEGWKHAEPIDAIPRGVWWEIYQIMELNALEEKVSVSNQNVMVAIAQYRQARDQVRIARAALFPTVTTAPNVVVSQANGSARTGSGAVFGGSQVAGTTGTTGTTGTGATGAVVGSGSSVNVDYSLPVDIAYQADVWGSIRRSVRGASDTAQASEADLENVRLMNQAQLAQLYFQLRGLDGDASLLQSALQLYERSLQLTKDRMQAGIVSGADVAQAETLYESTRAQYIDVGVARAQFEHAIAVLTGQPPAALSIPANPISMLPPPVPVGVPSELLERRPDVTAAERLMAAANEQIGIAQAAYFPTVTLNATGGFAASSLASLFTWPSRFWAIAPSLAETLFDAGKRHAQVDLERAAFDQTVASYRQTVLTALQQVEDQLAALRILEQEAQAEAAAVKAAQDALDIANEQYLAGTIDYLAVIIQQTALLTAQRTALDILTRRLTASVLLIEALGGGWNGLTEP
jgi:NodT family efflux transporter outer membrane factor (OMF) lipoprotein